MRHRVAKKKLNRDTDHRTALIRNLSRSLIIDGKIETTLAKAKFMQPYVEKLVTKAKKGTDISTLSNVNSKLRSKKAMRVLFEDLAPRYKNRSGGYTRIVKMGFRDGDKAPMARVEWVVEKQVEEKPAKEVKAPKATKAPKVVKKTETKTPRKPRAPKKEVKEENND